MTGSAGRPVRIGIMYHVLRGRSVKVIRIEGTRAVCECDGKRFETSTFFLRVK